MGEEISDDALLEALKPETTTVRTESNSSNFWIYGATPAQAKQIEAIGGKYAAKREGYYFKADREAEARKALDFLPGKELSSIKVSVPQWNESAGQEQSVEMSADKAVAEADQKLDLMRSLLECLAA
jgi:hypothetical protein